MNTVGLHELHSEFYHKTKALPPLPCAESVKEGRYSIDRFSEQWQEQRLNGWINVTNEYIEKVTTWETYYNIHETETRTVLILSNPVSEKPELIEKWTEDGLIWVAEKPEGESLPDGFTSNPNERMIGLLLNIRHETDCLPDHYYEWIDMVIHQWECDNDTPPEGEPVAESDQDISDYVDEYMDAMDKRYPNRRDEVAEKPEGESLEVYHNFLKQERFKGFTIGQVTELFYKEHPKYKSTPPEAEPVESAEESVESILKKHNVYPSSGLIYDLKQLASLRVAQALKK